MARSGWAAPGSAFRKQGVFPQKTKRGPPPPGDGGEHPGEGARPRGAPPGSSPAPRALPSGRALFLARPAVTSTMTLDGGGWPRPALTFSPPPPSMQMRPHPPLALKAPRVAVEGGWCVCVSACPSASARVCVRVSRRRDVTVGNLPKGGIGAAKGGGKKARPLGGAHWPRGGGDAR